MKVLALCLFLVFAHIAEGQAAQSNSNQGTTGMVAPNLHSNGAPTLSPWVCNANIPNVVYFQDDATNGKIWLCESLDAGATWNWVHLLSPISGTTVSIGGAALLLGGSVSGTATVTGAVAGNNCIATPSDGTILPVGNVIDCAVTAANTVTVRISALIAGTPPAKTYNVRILQ